jgi:hypothetical protein
MALRAPIAGRETQLAELAAVVGLRAETHLHALPHAPLREPSPPLVIVYGGVSTGKSLCVRHTLRAAADHFALVDCTGILTTRAFYREVLGQLHNNLRGKRPRHSATKARKSAALDDDDDVTITDAPPLEGAETAKRSQSSRSKRRRRVDEERKGSEAEDASESDSDADGDESDSEDDRVNEPLRRRPASTHTNGADGGEPAAHGSLNFLSFVKALRRHMDAALPLPEETAAGPKPTVFLALDHVETLLERGYGKLLTCLLAVNDQLDYLHVRGHGRTRRFYTKIMPNTTAVVSPRSSTRTARRGGSASLSLHAPCRSTWTSFSTAPTRHTSISHATPKVRTTSPQYGPRP